MGNVRCAAGILFVLVQSTACLIDQDARCGDQRVLGEEETCLCPPGTADSPEDLTCRPLADAGVDSSGDGSSGDGSSGPTGIGAPCSTHADCAQYDATFCESFQSFQCLIEHCSISPDDCPADYECCDFSSLGLANTLCVPDGQCPTG